MRVLSLSLLLLTTLVVVDARADGMRLAQATTKPSVAVLPLKASGLQLNEVQRFDLLVRTRFEQSGRFVVQDAASTTKLLEAAQGLGLDCDVNAIACARDVGQIADVALVVLGAAALVDEGAAEGRVGIDLVLIDVKQGTVVRRVSGLVPRAGGDAIPQTNARIAALLDENAPLAKAELKVTPDGARVFLNGTLRGTTPLDGPLTGLVPGEHQLRVERDDYLPHVTRFTLAPLEAADVEVVLIASQKTELVEREISLLEHAIPWSVAGGGVVTLLAGLGMVGGGLVPLVQHQSAADRLDDVAQDNAGYASHVEGVWAEQNAHAEAWNSWGRILVGVGTTASVVGTLVAGAGTAWGITMIVLAVTDDGAPALASETGTE